MCQTDLMRATMKPIMKGDRNGEMMKPIVQILSLKSSCY